MTTFEIYLLKPDDRPLEPQQLLDAFQPAPLFFLKEPGRILYRDEDKGVFFHLFIPSLSALEEEPAVESDPGEAAEEEAEDGGANAHREDEDQAAEIEMAPAVVMVPLLCPSFFAEEALSVAERAAKALDLSLGHSEDHAEAHGDLLAGWTRARAEALDKLQDRSDLAYWGPRKCAEWRAYGAGRSSLAAELGIDAARIPRLLAARHQGRVKSLCAFRPGESLVLPVTDLVLLRRERVKKGLLFSRKATEEGMAIGDDLWRILEPFGVPRGEPAPLLVLRDGAVPQQVAAQLEVMDLVPLEEATRTELVGVLDLDPPAAGPSPEGART